MKTKTPALAFLAAILPSCALAQQRAPELPAMSSIVEALGARPEARPHGKDDAVAAKTAPVACLAWAGTVQVGRGVFDDDYDVTISGQKVGEVHATGDGYVIKDNAGAVQASAVRSGQTYTVTGCNGAPLGAIEELDGSSSSAFNIKGAGGEALMTTGWVDGGDMAASAPKASMKVEKNGLFDHFTATINGAAPEIGVFATVMNNAAAYKRSAERRRERMMDGPHGSAGRD